MVAEKKVTVTFTAAQAKSVVKVLRYIERLGPLWFFAHTGLGRLQRHATIRATDAIEEAMR